MSNSHYYCIIMAGGVGSRFWPISRADKPKQFLEFSSVGKSFLRLTYDRMKQVIPEDNIIVVSLTKYEGLVREHLPELKRENLLLEPYNRNTAPCITFATYTLLKRDPLAVTVVTPADHLIPDSGIFNDAIFNALAYAAGSDALITLGVVPTRPDSNFGYIQVAGEFEDDRPVKVKTFTEKPDVDLARVFIDSGEFLWNSGIFVWRASAIREELELHAPEITNLWKGAREALDTDAQETFIRRIYTDCPRVSIDYAVMEKTSNAWVYPAKFRWADIGNWDSLYENLAIHDSQGNSTDIAGKALMEDDIKNIIYSPKKDKLIALRGLENMIVIDTEDVLLICPRNDEKFWSFLSELAMPEYNDYR